MVIQPTFRLQRLSKEMLVEEVSNWTASQEYNYYMGFGGAGDALLLVACCWDDPAARVLFFNSSPMCKQLFELFDLETLIHPNIFFSPLSHQIYDIVVNRKTFKPSAHLPDGMNVSDWTNWRKYKDRMVTSVPWAQLLGKYQNPFPTKGIVVVCPSGAFREAARQRFISDYEYTKLVKKLLSQNYTVVTADSPEHMRLYSNVDHPHSMRCTTTYLQFNDGHKEELNLASFLQVVNAAEFCISVETWLVPYCGLVGLSVQCIQTRYFGTYKYGHVSPDYIFVNPEMWPTLQLVTAEEVCY